MRVPALLILVVIGAIAAAVISYNLKQQRIAAWRQAASGLGLQYAQQDPFGLDDLAFTLFTKGDGRGCENVAWGTYKGLETKVFEYWYYVTSTDGKGHTSRTYHRYTCALANTSLFAPSLTIARETLMTRLADAVGLRDIDFESEEFNRAYQVRCGDKKFASYLIDARMMAWLLTVEGVSIEACNDLVLVATRRGKPAAIPFHVGVAHAFCERIPSAARAEWGA